jgi:hypothetical protein
MKKKKTPYLDFYYKCTENGKLPCEGLCAFLDEKDVKLIAPYAIINGKEVYDTYHNLKWRGYWAEDLNRSLVRKNGGFYFFGETRQTLTLLLAAMNNEL